MASNASAPLVPVQGDMFKPAPRNFVGAPVTMRHRILLVLMDGRWYSIRALTNRLNHPGCTYCQTNVGARLRDLRKARYGGYDIECRRNPNTGSYEYRRAF